MFFVVELNVNLGVRPWEPVNIIKADNGRAAIDLANALFMEMFDGEIKPGWHRVRRISDLVCATLRRCFARTGPSSGRTRRLAAHSSRTGSLTESLPPVIGSSRSAEAQ